MLQEVGEIVSKLVFGGKAKNFRQELDIILNSWKSRLSLTQVKGTSVEHSTSDILLLLLFQHSGIL